MGIRFVQKLITLNCENAYEVTGNRNVGLFVMGATFGSR